MSFPSNHLNPFDKDAQSGQQPPQYLNGQNQQPQQGGFPPQQPQQGGFPPQQPQQGGFPHQQPQQGGFPHQQPQQGGFPSHQQPQQGGFPPQQQQQPPQQSYFDGNPPPGNPQFASNPGGFSGNNNTGESLSQPLYGASPTQAVTRFFKKYARFSGYASRSEFWWAYGAYLAFAFVIGFIAGLAGENSGITLLMSGILALVGLGVFIPLLALSWRRLHDAGYSGAMFFLGLIPFIGGIIVFILFLLPTNPAKHQLKWADNTGD